MRLTLAILLAAMQQQSERYRWHPGAETTHIMNLVSDHEATCVTTLALYKGMIYMATPSQRVGVGFFQLVEDPEGRQSCAPCVQGIYLQALY